MKTDLIISGGIPIVMICLSHLSTCWLTVYFVVYFLGFIVLAFFNVLAFLSLKKKLETKHIKLSDTFLTLTALEDAINQNDLHDEFIYEIRKIKTKSKAIGIYFISGIFSVMFNLWLFDV